MPRPWLLVTGYWFILQCLDDVVAKELSDEAIEGRWNPIGRKAGVSQLVSGLGRVLHPQEE